MRKLLLLLILSLTIQAQGQQFQFDLYGFKLGQFRDAAKNELGKPLQSGKFEDGFVYEAFLLKPDSSLHIIFEYAAKDTNVIWSIQVTGFNSSTDIGFKNAKMGIEKPQIENLLGKPSTIKEIGEYGQKWEYDSTNFSIEVNPKGKLSSVKISDKSHDLYPSPDFNKLPSFELVQKTLNSSNNEDILNLLSGDVEIYIKDSTYSIRKSFKTEQEKDYSKMISIIRKISKDLSTVNPKNEKEYFESMRIALGQDPKHVMKFPKGHTIKEIVFKYYGGKYLIYEINTNKE